MAVEVAAGLEIVDYRDREPWDPRQLFDRAIGLFVANDALDDRIHLGQLFATNSHLGPKVRVFVLEVLKTRPAPGCCRIGGEAQEVRICWCKSVFLLEFLLLTAFVGYNPVDKAGRFAFFRRCGCYACSSSSPCRSHLRSHRLKFGWGH